MLGIDRVVIWLSQSMLTAFVSRSEQMCFARLAIVKRRGVNRSRLGITISGFLTQALRRVHAESI